MPKPAPADRVPAHIRGLGKVHHVALVVGSIEDALGLWRDQLGLELETVMDIGTDRVRIAFLTVGESKIELVEPTDDTTGVARFLASKGEGFHHVCFEVPNLAETLLRLEIDGLELIDTAPRKGAEGPVAFLHPRSCHGVLVELIEAPGGPAWGTLGYESADAPESKTTEEEDATMIITTTTSIEGRPVRDYIGIVTGEAILGANIFKDLFAGIRDIVGGRSGAYEEELRKARTIALEDLAAAASQLGADAVIGVDLDYETVGQGGSMLMVTASGTAVRLG